VVSQKHINAIFMHQFSPWRLAKDSLRGAPDVVDALVKAPLLVTEGLRMIEQATRRPQENPFAGLTGTLLAGFCLIGGAILVAFKGPWPIWVAFFILALVLALRRR
jgi:ubiquinone biosynthesis protein